MTKEANDYALFSKQYKDTDFNILMRQVETNDTQYSLYPKNKGLGLDVYIGSQKIGVINYIGRLSLRAIGHRMWGIETPRHTQSKEVTIPFEEFDDWMNDVFNQLNEHFELKELLSCQQGVHLGLKSRVAGLDDEDVLLALMPKNRRRTTTSLSDDIEIGNWEDLDWDSISST